MGSATRRRIRISRCNKINGISMARLMIRTKGYKITRSIATTVKIIQRRSARRQEQEDGDEAGDEEEE